MAATIKIKRSTGTTAPSSLVAGELAYSGGTGAQNNGGGRLYVGDPANGSVLTIGGKYFTDMLDQTPGTLTASSAIVVDADKKIDELLVDNLSLNGNAISTTDTNGSLVLSPAGSGLVNFYNQYTFPRTSGASGQLLVTNGEGTISWGNITSSDVTTALGYTPVNKAGDTMSGNLNMGGTHTVTNLAAPTNASDAATKAYVDAVAEGLHIHPSCQAGTTTTLAVASGGTVTYNNGTAGVGATLTTTGTFTALDGVTLTSGMRILVKNEVEQAHNGIYVFTSDTVLTRATDFDSAPEIDGGDFTFVTAGTTLNSTGWVQIDPVPVVGTDPIVFTQFSGAGVYTASNGLTLVGNDFQMASSAAGSGLTFTSGVLSVNAANGLEVTAGNVQLASSAAGAGLTLTSGVLAVGGTADRITVSTDSVDIAATYTGQSSITTLGTITAGTWNGNTIAIANGGTGQTTAVTAFNALSPTTTAGDMIYNNGTNNVRLGVGAVNQLLGSDGTNPIWKDITVTNTIYVTKGGSDTTGNGSLTNPYRTVTKAMTAVGSPTINDSTVINVGPGHFTEAGALTIKPWVFIVGTGWRSTRITPTSFSLDNASWAGGGDKRAGATNVTLNAATTIDFQSTTSTDGKWYSEAVVYNSTLTITAGYPINQFIIFGGWVWGNLTLNGNQGIFNSVYMTGTVTVNQPPVAGIVNHYASFNQCTIQGNFTLNANNATLGNMPVNLISTPLNANLTINGNRGSLTATSDSLPNKTQITNTSNMTIFRKNDAYGVNMNSDQAGYWSSFGVNPYDNFSVQLALDTLVVPTWNNTVNLRAVQTITANATLPTGGSLTDYSKSVILADATSGPITVTLPNAADWSAKYWTIKKIDNTSNTVTVVSGTVGQTIDGNANVVLRNLYDDVTVVAALVSAGPPAVGTYYRLDTEEGVASFSGGTTGLTPSTATTGAVTLGGTLNIANGGTGATTANDAFNALAPAQTLASGKYLKSGGTNATWEAAVDSLTGDAGTATGLTLTPSASTGAVTLALGGTLLVANGGTGTTNGSITGTGALTFTAGGTNTNVVLVPNGSGTVDVSGKKITSVAAPEANTDAANKQYVDTAIDNLGAAGSNTQIQFNNAGEFGASANFTFNSTTNAMVVGPTSTGIKIDGAANTITTTGTDADLILSPNGNGSVVLDSSGSGVIESGAGETLTVRGATGLTLQATANDITMAVAAGTTAKVTVSGPDAADYATGLADNDLVTAYWVQNAATIDGGTY